MQDLKILNLIVITIVKRNMQANSNSVLNL